METDDATLWGSHPLTTGPQLERMQASVRRRMFGGGAATLGRFTLLDRLGSGAMGVVHEAQDPDLDRRVAIKVLRHTSSGERLVREARQLARLSHPNVVTIHEVGELRGEVFLVMELLGGGTLRAWLDAEPRPWRDVLGMLIEAGRGLAAAHRLGLVHRDFKPDNVLLGDDGRPRVVDFGLTREADDSGEGEVLFSGTPAYMAPEQHRGIATARSDQFAFCVVLHEALSGWRPGAKPRRSAKVRGTPSGSVMRALRRGLAPDPEDRFPDMHALLVALERGGRRRRWLPLAAVSVVGVTLAAVTLRPLDAAGPCGEARALVKGARDRNLQGSGSREALEAQLERYLLAADTTIDDVCDGKRSIDPRAPEVLSCVRRRVLQTEVLGALRAEGALDVDQAVQVSRLLPAPAACSDPTLVASEPVPPIDPALAQAERSLRDEVERARTLRIAGLQDRARERLETTLASAVSLPSPVAQAEAELELGRVQGIDGHVDLSIETLRHAIVTAERAGHPRCRAWAQLELGGSLASTGAFDAAREEFDRAEATVERIGGPDGLPAALLENRGHLAFRQGHYAKAARHFERAIALNEAVLGSSDFALVGPVNLLGASLIQSGQTEPAIAAFERARDLVDLHFGTEHPLLGRVLNNLGNARLSKKDYIGAKANLELALAVNERNLGPEHPSTSIARSNLGRVRLALGEYEAAERDTREGLEIAERVHGAESPELRFALGSLAHACAFTGRVDEALGHLQRAEALIDAAWGTDAVQHLDIAADWQAVLHVAGSTDERSRRREQVERLLATLDVEPPEGLREALDGPAP